jgi:nitroreductase
MSQTINQDALDQLFLKARSHNGWLDEPVTEEQLTQLYDLMKMGPTSANSCPLRIVFLQSQEARERIKSSMSQGNVEKTMTAPVVAILAMDMEFYEQLPKLFPHEDARSWYAGKPDKILDAAFRNSTLQAAYFIMAARAIGLDTGPMSGFDADKLNQEFFPDGKWKVNFVCSLGRGDSSKIYPRHPRLSFDEACKLL